MGYLEIGRGFSHAEGGGKTSFGLVLARELAVLAMLSKGARGKCYPVSRGRGFQTHDFPSLCSPPPLPVIYSKTPLIRISGDQFSRFELRGF